MTEYSRIYDRALFHLRDAGLLNMEAGLRNEVLRMYLMSAQTDFQPSCLHNLSDFSDENESFNEDLDNESIEILAFGIMFYWLSSQTLRSDLLRNVLTGRDFKSYSPANLLKEIHALRDTVKSEYRSRINAYGYRNLPWS